MLRVPKISSKPNEVSVSLSSTTSGGLFGALQSKMTVFCSKMAAATRGKKNLLGLYGINSDKEATALFSVHFAPSPPPSQQNVKYLLDSKFFFFFYSYRCYFKVLSLALTCLCLTGRLNVLAFLKTTDTATGCHVEKRKKKVLFLWNGGERKKAATAELPHLSVGEDVCVCVYVCECVFLCANRQRSEAAERGGSRM